jgi:hypothetical protein
LGRVGTASSRRHVTRDRGRRDAEHAKRPFCAERDLIALVPDEHGAPVGRRIRRGAVRPLKPELVRHPILLSDRDRTARRASPAPVALFGRCSARNAARSAARARRRRPDCKRKPRACGAFSCGAYRDRTGDLRLAKPVPTESAEGGSEGETADLAGDSEPPLPGATGSDRANRIAPWARRGMKLAR